MEIFPGFLGENDKCLNFCYIKRDAEIAQLVERQLPKLNVEGSSPFFRSKQDASWRLFFFLPGVSGKEFLYR